MIKTEFGETIIATTSNNPKDMICELFADLMTILKAIENKCGKATMLYLLMKCVEYMEKEDKKK